MHSRAFMTFDWHICSINKLVAWNFTLAPLFDIWMGDVWCVVCAACSSRMCARNSWIPNRIMDTIYIYTWHTYILHTIRYIPLQAARSFRRAPDQPPSHLHLISQANRHVNHQHISILSTYNREFRRRKWMPRCPFYGTHFFRHPPPARVLKCECMLCCNCNVRCALGVIMLSTWKSCKTDLELTLIGYTDPMNAHCYLIESKPIRWWWYTLALPFNVLTLRQ